MLPDKVEEEQIESSRSMFEKTSGPKEAPPKDDGTMPQDLANYINASGGEDKVLDDLKIERLQNVLKVSLLIQKLEDSPDVDPASDFGILLCDLTRSSAHGITDVP